MVPSAWGFTIFLIIFLLFISLFFPESFIKEKLDTISDGFPHNHLVPYFLVSQNQEPKTRSANLACLKRFSNLAYLERMSEAL